MTEHDEIEQLAALLEGEGAPDALPSLDALTGLATAVRDHAELMAPTAEFRAGLRAELLAAADAPPGLLERTRSAWAARTARARSSARVAVATMTASSMIGSAGIAVAAQGALPGDALYGLKSLTEDARLALSADGIGEARLHLALARERLEELQASAGQLEPGQVVALLAEMDAHSEAGAEALLDAVLAGTADADEVRSFTSIQRSGLVGMFNRLPLLAKPVAEDSLELLRRIELTASRTGPAAAPDGDRDAEGVLDELQEARAAAEAGRDDSDTTPLGEASLDVPLPGEQPAIPVPECDCLELADGHEPREPSSAGDEPADTAGEPGPEQGRDQDREQGEDPEPEHEHEPLDPGDGLAVPEPEGGDEREDNGELDSSTSLKQLPSDEVAGAASDVIGTDQDADDQDADDEADESEDLDSLLG